MKLISNNVSVSLVKGSYKVISLRFRNEGNGTLDSLTNEIHAPNQLKVEFLERLISLSPGKQGDVKLNVSSNTPGKYQITLIINNSHINKKYNIPVIVQPTKVEENKINTSYLSLLNELNQLKDVLGEEDPKYQFLMKKLNSIKQLIAKGDYLDAKQQLQELNNSIMALKQSKTLEHKTSIWTIIVIVLIILLVLGGVFYYLWTPPKNEYNPYKMYGKYNYNTLKYDKSRESVKGLIERIKDKIKNKKDEGKFVYRYK